MEGREGVVYVQGEWRIRAGGGVPKFKKKFGGFARNELFKFLE